MDCVDVCLEIKKGSFWGEAGAGYLPSENNKVKVWESWRGFLLVDCCGWVVIFGSVFVEICWGGDHWESGTRCVGSWGQNLTTRKPT